MSHSHPVSVAFSFVSALLLTAGLAQAQAHLEHSAPMLGRTLELEVDGAPAHEHVALYYSPRSAQIPTPFGVLELRRRELREIAARTSDASGHASFQIRIPLDAAFAEREAHFQALVTDPSTSAGKRFTNANHLKLLGTRLYAHERSFGPDPAIGSLEIIDAIHDTVTARIDFGLVADDVLTNVEGKPVFANNFGVGAVMASATRLVFFDPFFGGMLGECAVAPASRILWTDSAGTSVYMLEKGSTLSGGQPARVRQFEFATRNEIAAVTLPEPASGLWCTNDSASEAYIGAFDATSGAVILRRIALASLIVQDSISVGTTLTREFDHMQYAAGQVFVTSHEPLGFGFQNTLARVQTGSSSLSALLEGSQDISLPRFVAVPAVDRLLVSTKWPWIPTSGLFEEPLSMSGPATSVLLPWVYLSCDDMVAQDTSVWVMDRNDNEPPGGTEPGRLYRIDMTTHAWMTYPHNWPFVGPHDLELVRDAFTDKIFLACRGVLPPIGIAPAVFVIDQDAGTDHNLELANSPESLLAVPVH